MRYNRDGDVSDVFITLYRAWLLMDANQTMVVILESVVGAPSNDVESLFLYLGAVVMSVLMVFFIIHIMKIVGGLIK